MFCTHCGAPAQTDDEFCAVCGRRLHHPESPEWVAAPATTSRGRSRGVWLVAIVSLLGVLAIGGAAGSYWLMGATQKEAPVREGSGLVVTPTPAEEAPSAVTESTPSEDPPSSSPPATADFAALFAEVKSGVVMIRATTCDGEGVGSGFLVSPRQVVTAAHVVDGAASVAVSQGDGVYAARVTHLDPEADVAFLRLSEPLEGGHRFRLADADAAPGAGVAVIGHPLGDPMTITEGNVSRADGELWPQIQLDVSVSPGNSGGPVVDHEGAVVGVLLSKDAEADGLAYALRSDFVARAVDGTEPLEPFQEASCARPLGPDYTEIPPAPVGAVLRDAIAETFANYFGGINSGDYLIAYDELAPELQNGFDDFSEGVSTSFDFDFQVNSVNPTPNGAEVWLEFVSIQDPSHGPDGEACTEWSLDYQLTWLGDGDMVIAGAVGHEGDGHNPC